MLSCSETAVAPQKVELFDRLMSGADKPVIVLGRNKYAERVSRALNVSAFVDDFTTQKTFVDKPVIRMADLPNECLVVSCVMDTVPVTAWDRLRSAGVRDVIDYFALARLAPKTFAPVDFCSGNRADILEHKARYQQVYDRLADETSKQHFAKVVAFRLNMDLEQMRGFSLAIDRQYFEPFIPVVPKGVFVDGGGYDGQTTRQFAAWNPAYRKVYYFEPLPAMMEISRKNLAGMRDVSFVQKGLFSRNDRLRFEAGAGPASSISPTGQIEIEVVRLDDEVREPITFLKLDIEGAEHEAIRGAAEHIRSETPTLAVCIYHDQQDFWRVPQRVLEINDRYNLFVRHYSESVRETVMFFVPKGR